MADLTRHVGGVYLHKMAQETVIHRIDAELGTGQPVAPVPDDLAVDGIDQLLQVFVAYGVAARPPPCCAGCGIGRLLTSPAE